MTRSFNSSIKKIFRVTLGQRLNWTPYLKEVRNKMHKKLTLLIKMLRNRRYCPDPSKLLRIYHTLIRLTFDYGSLAYTTPQLSQLKILDPIHHSGIRISYSYCPYAIFTCRTILYLRDAM